MLKTISRIRNRHFFIIDIIVFLLSPLLALTLRMDSFHTISHYSPTIFYVSILFLLVKISILYMLGIYRRYWKQASIDELALLIVAMIIIGFVDVVSLSLFNLLSISPQLPRSISYIDTIVTLLLLGFSRMTVRLALRYHDRGINQNSKRTLIIGAGHAGVSLAMDMQRNSFLGFTPTAFIDDDRTKIGLRVRGIDIVGDRSDIPRIVKKLKIDQIILAMPSASGSDLRNILSQCANTGLKVFTLPSLAEIMNGNVQVTNIREINIVDLLRREPIETDTMEVEKFISGKRILVTGAGGSIGSEICRQVLKFSPSEIILMGHGENSIFDINNELLQLVKNYKNNIVKISSVIADIRFKPRLTKVLDKYKPNIILHAAAHKHVPLMEDNPIEAVTNNILGTKNLVECADAYGVDNFVMISTDKAVNPLSIMGASKRAAEIIVMQKAFENKKSYVCVRFGNVLGSRGSVIPIFKKQIEKGGPVIVTHPEVKRYFMTIPEAVQLVLQASIIGSGGEIFVLDMGEPIKIVDLAKDMVRLSGFKEYEIPIIYSGLRPGEKLFEELFIEGEQYESTKHKKILIAANASKFIPDNFDKFISSFEKCVSIKNDSDIIEVFKEMIPEYNTMN